MATKFAPYPTENRVLLNALLLVELGMGRLYDFTEKTRNLLRAQAGYKCCNPSCRALTDHVNEKVSNLGECAHIESPKFGEARYRVDFDKAASKSPENGIWLCRMCHKLIDDNEASFPISILLSWKRFFQETNRQDDTTFHAGLPGHINHDGLIGLDIIFPKSDCIVDNLWIDIWTPDGKQRGAAAYYFEDSAPEGAPIKTKTWTRHRLSKERDLPGRIYFLFAGKIANNMCINAICVGASLLAGGTTVAVNSIVYRTSIKKEQLRLTHIEEVRFKPEIPRSDSSLFSAIDAAKANEWARLHVLFKNAAELPDRPSLYSVLVESFSDGVLCARTKDDHITSLWQYGGGIKDILATMDLAKAKGIPFNNVFSQYGYANALMTEFGIISGSGKERFLELAGLAGSVLPTSTTSDLYMHILLGMPDNNDKPSLVVNRHPLSLWIKVVLLANSIVHPGRWDGPFLRVDAFTASLAVFQLFNNGVTSSDIKDMAVPPTNPGDV